MQTLNSRTIRERLAKNMSEREKPKKSRRHATRSGKKSGFMIGVQKPAAKKPESGNALF